MALVECFTTGPLKPSPRLVKHFVINGLSSNAHLTYTDCFYIFFTIVAFLLFTLSGLQTLKIRGSSIEQGVAK